MSDYTKTSTEELLKLLFKEQSLPRILSQIESDIQFPSFSEYLSKLSEEKNLSHESILKKANVEKSYGHKIFAGKRNPSRDTVIMLAFGIEADIETVQNLLRYAGKSILYPKLKRDAAVIYCLHKHISLEKTQIILYELGLPVLGEGR